MLIADCLYGLTPTQFTTSVATDLGRVVISERDEEGFVRLGSLSFPGYFKYDDIYTPLDSQEQARATTIFDS